ncbi:SIR2 family protein [Sorangium sp. So ce1099]|uniref:SIR2 family NAD-dependent protein deacylase n=1 Tax=Sorangium sp. So ce1099 TaxID=3133331 RepID=UPI003F6391E6
MDKHIIELRERLLLATFDEANAKIIVEWLIAAEWRKPVVLVGAGFSRNARHKLRGDYARPAEVPLWWDVAKQMATHLRVDVGQYDAPTMAEMYETSFGEADLRDLLRGMLPDEDLEPGEAHRALAGYDAEAVITTNLLDTLLDVQHKRTRRWNRVIADADLSATLRNYRRAPDLIYFHGHRGASDTWIMTRAQYEDVAKSRPVVVARVRQLMAQFPLLIVGFGMGDPNFHNLYRQVSKDMRRHQPLGLAIQIGNVSEAERRHWDALGIRIAVPKNWRTLQSDPAESNRFFEWLFKNVSTSWQPDDNDMLEYVRAGKEPQDRFDRFKGVLSSRRATDGGGRRQAEPASEFSAWEKALFSFLTPDDEEAAEDAARRASQREHNDTIARAARVTATAAGDAAAAARSTTGVAKEEPDRFTHMPMWKYIRLSDTQAWRLDTVLNHTQHAWRAVAEHFQLALERGLFRTESAELGSLPWIPLTFWLAIKGNGSTFPALPKLARTCIERAIHYGDEHWVEIIQEEAKKAGVHIEVDASKIDSMPASGEVIAASQGFLAMLNGDHETARIKYREAADRAEAEDLEFEEWAWRQGELQAIGALSSPFKFGGALPDEREKFLPIHKEECRARIRALAETGAVLRWQNITKARIRRTLEHALERYASRVRHRTFGGSGRGFSSDPHMAWRSFRDLKAIHAPPHLLEEHLAPLLWERGFSPEVELGYRMLFDISRTKEWLEQLLYEPTESIDKQRERDAKLVETFLDSGKEARSKSGLVGRLLALPGIKEAMRTGDVVELLEWLADTRRSLGTEVTTYCSQRLLWSDYPKALRAVASLARSEQIRPVFDAWREGAKDLELDELARAVHSLPWHRWALVDPKEVAAWLGLVTEWALASYSAPQAESAETQAPPVVSREDEMLAFGFLKMVADLKEKAPELLDARLRAQLSRWADELRGRAMHEDYLWEARRGGYLLEQALRQEPGASTEELFDRWSTHDGWASPDSGGRQRLRWSLITDAFTERDGWTANETALRERLRTLWKEIESEEHWQPIKKRNHLNPHMAAPIVRFLTTCLLFLDEARELAAKRLLAMLGAAPGTLIYVAPALTPNAWGASWPDFVDRILASAGGAGGTRGDDLFDDGSGRATEHQVGAIGLWSEHARRVRRGLATADDGLSVLLRPMRSAALLALSDERTLLANHAAYAVVGAAEIAADDAETMLLAHALQRIAHDTRVTVRMAAAYAGGRLSMLARSPRVREVAARIRDVLADDENAMVSTQRELGELEAEHERKKRQQPSDSPRREPPDGAATPTS